MTAAPPNRPTLAAVPPTLAAALARAGHDLPPEPAPVLAGPLLSRWSFSTVAGEHLWVDVPAQPEPGASTAPPSLARGRVQLAVPIVLTDVLSQTPTVGAGVNTSGVVYLAPWAPALLATEITSGGPEHPPTTELGAELGAELGRLLRRLHDTPSRTAAEPDAVRRVLAVDPPGRTDRELGAAWDRVRAGWAAGPAVRLHGEPSTGHLLVPSRPERDAEVLAVLIGWTGRPAGPAWFDVGYLIGDLLELAQLTPLKDDLIELATRVRRGYDGDRPRPAAFWRSAADAAAVKVLDHEARIVSSFGPQPQASAALSAVGRAVLDQAHDLGPISRR